MDVSAAVDRRMSTRAFLSTPVPTDTILDLLRAAARAPSGGNVQPWKIHVVNGAVRDRFVAAIAERAPGAPAYDVYPAGLWEPHRTARFELGEQMYARIGIAREDKAGRFAHLARNFEFFGAPAAIFCFIDRRMGPPQWSDLGMFLQTFMLLAEEAGLATCAQEAWATHAEAVTELLGLPDELMVFCGVAIGHADTAAPVNSLRSERLELDRFVTVVDDLAVS